MLGWGEAGSRHSLDRHIPSLHLLPLLLLALAQPLRDRRSPVDQRGFIREPLRKVRVILLHDVEHRILGEAAVVLGEEFVQVGEFVVIHGYGASGAMPDYSASS